MSKILTFSGKTKMKLSFWPKAFDLITKDRRKWVDIESNNEKNGSFSSSKMARH
jgi:hypothetical protein